MVWFERIISRVARTAQFKVNLKGRLFFEYFLGSFFLSAAAALILLLISGSLFWFIGFVPRRFVYLFGAVWLLVMRFSMLVVPLFLLSRLVLVFKKDGVSAFCGALLGVLIVLIPFLGLVYISAALWSTF